MPQEIDYLMGTTMEGVKTYDENSAAIARVAEWLDTPTGQVWGSPLWGNNLTQYRHEPMNGDTAAAMENSIALKLPSDLPDIAISRVLCDPVNADTWKIKIYISNIKQSLNKEVVL